MSSEELNSSGKKKNQLVSLLLILVFFFTDALSGLTSYVSLTTFYILSAAFSTWVTFSFGRYAGMAYCAMKEAKEHSEISPEKEGKIG